MLVDFCHWSLQTVVTCDKPSSDGYEPQNLVSRDPAQRCKGFLAANFIKPPVNITFQFPCKISIHQILINPSVGAQKSTQIEIYTSSKRVKSSWLISQDATDHSTKGKLGFDSPFFVNIGKVNLTESAMVCFRYPRFSASCPFSLERCHMDGCVVSELRNQRYQYLTAVSEMTVRVVRTSGSCVPALKSIQIIGQPAVSNGKEILNKVYKIYYESKYPAPVAQVETLAKPDPDHEKMDPGLQIPEEFLDPITCEIMALPLLLPCGKSVDQSTLERFISTESSWGRSASDPFTGVTFTAESRPIPNDSLKARIDAFLLHNANSDTLKSVPRTVGRREETAAKRINTKSQPSISYLTSDVSNKRNLESSDGPQSKKSKITSANPFHEQSVINCSKSEIVLRPQPSTSVFRGGNSSNPNPPSTSHVHQLNNSLSQALSLLNDLPSFTKRANTEKHEEVEKSNVCVNCSALLDQATTAYCLPCTHIICRKCLVQRDSSNQTISCGNCHSSSKLSAAVRVHVL